MRPNTIMFNGKPVRTVRVEGELWFVASDVARVLGYAEPLAAIRQHCKLRHPEKIHTDSGPRLMNIIPSGDVLRLVMRSRLEDAESYRTWLLNRMGGTDLVEVEEEDQDDQALETILGIVKKMKERRRA